MMDIQSSRAEPFLTHSAAHYLLAIADLLDNHGYARVTDVAGRLGLTRGSVSVALQSLKDADYLVQDENRFFQLTSLGRQAVAGVRVRHSIVEQFLMEVLDLSQEQAHRESCRVENLIEGPTARRLHALLEYWRENKLGDVIKSKETSGCPACPTDVTKECPCCGLECIDGQCLFQTGSPAGGEPL